VLPLPDADDATAQAHTHLVEHMHYCARLGVPPGMAYDALASGSLAVGPESVGDLAMLARDLP
jgi:hypothetical protein